MAAGKKKLVLELFVNGSKTDENGFRILYAFRVVKATNITEPRVMEQLEKEAVDALIEAGIEVDIIPAK